MTSMKSDAVEIIRHAIAAADPYGATKKLLESLDTGADKLTVFSIGKAAVPMAAAAEAVFKNKIKNGLIVTKYKHLGDFSLPSFEAIEAAHPVSDGNSIIAAEKALEIAEGLAKDDVCIVLLSGGGSALCEKSIVSPEKQRDITKKLLARGAEIDEINAIRRRISLVKGGRLAAAAYPARVFTVALSDVLSNDKSVIASGITVQDTMPPQEVLRILNKYLPEYSAELHSVIYEAGCLKINDGGFFFAGDINSLCDAAEKKARALGYSAAGVSRSLTGEASDRAAEIIRAVPDKKGKRAYIYGGETTVTLKGAGLGGRNQEMALRAAIELDGKKNIVFASAGSDGTDGPTDAAGGTADGKTYARMCAAGLSPEKELADNNSNRALDAVGELIVTGPTGTNVNDLTVILTSY